MAKGSWRMAALRSGLVDASRVLLAVGARRVFLPLRNAPRIERSTDLSALERRSLDFGRAYLYADHMSGGNGMGADVRIGVTDPGGRVFGTRNIFVANASLFPSPCGVSPSWTVMALSHRVATGPVDRDPSER